MAYVLEAILAPGHVLEPHGLDYPHGRLVALRQGIAMFPVTDALLADVAGVTEAPRRAFHYGQFRNLTATLERWIVTMSCGGPVAYVEACYEGGPGYQIASVWRGGRVVIGPLHTDDGAGRRRALRAGAINRALRSMGVRPGDALDEFDAVGLGAHRMTGDWLTVAEAPEGS